jgi:phage terminase small subunit
MTYGPGMPVLPNAKHERFAQELAKGKTATEAYILAGYKPNDGNAATLKGNQRVLERVTEIQDRSAIRAEITIQSLIEEAAEIQAAALRDGQHSAAVGALTAKAKLAGLWVEKTENKNRNVDASNLSDGDLAAVVAGEGGGNPSEKARNTQKLN